MRRNDKEATNLSVVAMFVNCWLLDQRSRMVDGLKVFELGA